MNFFLSQYILYNLVKYCIILEDFEKPAEKCPRLKSSVHYRLRNFKMKSVKSFVGHPIFCAFLISFSYLFDWNVYQNLTPV